ATIFASDPRDRPPDPGITPDTALRLARYFHTSPGFWLNLQSSYDLEVAQDKLSRTIEREVRPSTFAAGECCLLNSRYRSTPLTRPDVVSSSKAFPIPSLLPDLPRPGSRGSRDAPNYGDCNNYRVTNTRLCLFCHKRPCALSMTWAGGSCINYDPRSLINTGRAQ